MRQLFEQFSFWSALDIAIISFICYELLLLIRGTRAAQILTGILITLAAFGLSMVVPLTTLNWLMGKFYSSFLIIIIIIFQDDIRHMLSKMGKKPLLPVGERGARQLHYLIELSEAAFTLASRRIGGLLVLERTIILNRYLDVGLAIDALVSKDLIWAIFNTQSPIHDGAVIIQHGRIAAAGCFLPLSRQDNLDPSMGTRHRAALGVSLATDALVILISEESGKVSVVVDGKIKTQTSREHLLTELRAILKDKEEDHKEDSTIVKLWKKTFNKL